MSYFELRRDVKIGEYYLMGWHMVFGNKIKVIVFLNLVNFFCCLFAMEKQPRDERSSQNSYAPLDLEKQIFGRRIRIENQTGIRILLKIFNLDGYAWKTVLEDNASSDIGSLDEIPAKATFEPYGQTARLFLGHCVLAIALDDFSKFRNISNNKTVVVRIKKFGILDNNIEILTPECRKNAFLDNLFPSVDYYMISEHSHGGAYRTIEEFKAKNSIKLARYVLGLSKDFMVCDLKARSKRLLEEWNPELYEPRSRSLVGQIRDYIEWAKNVLPFVSHSVIAELAKLSDSERDDLIKIMQSCKQTDKARDEGLALPSTPATSPDEVEHVYSLSEIKGPEIKGLISDPAVLDTVSERDTKTLTNER
jgi:hypothetical protein